MIYLSGISRNIRNILLVNPQYKNLFMKDICFINDKSVVSIWYNPNTNSYSYVIKNKGHAPIFGSNKYLFAYSSK